jgi:hypothetical protein
VRLNEVYRNYRDAVDFYCVYIQEAHPDDGWQVASNLEQGVVYKQPSTQNEREELANVCALRLNLEMPMVLDDMDNTVDTLYAALPERLYVLDSQGLVRFRTVVGSPGFDVDAWETAIASVQDQQHA